MVNDKVAVLAGFGLTPLGLRHRADRHAEQDADGRDGRGHVEHHERVAFIVRSSFTLPQATVGIAEWAAKNNITKVVDLGQPTTAPGIDAEKTFKQTFTAGTAARSCVKLRIPTAQPRLRAFPAARARRASDAVFAVRALGRRRGAS